MMSNPDSAPQYSPELIQRARSGDQAAWEILFNECYPKIVRVIRRRMSKSLRKHYDSTDIANEVMKSLAAKFNDLDFSSINGLRAFLINAAQQKMVDGYRRCHAQKRDLARDRQISSGEVMHWEPIDRSPTPSQLAVATEGEEILLDGQTGKYRTVIEMKLQGLSNADVAHSTGWHIRKIERFLQNLRGTWRF